MPEFGTRPIPRDVWRDVTEPPLVGVRALGVGWLLYRRHQLDETGFRGTLYFCLLAFPILPLAQYEYDRPSDGPMTFHRVGPVEWRDWLYPLYVGSVLAFLSDAVPWIWHRLLLQ